MQDSKIAYRRKAIPEGQGAGRAAGQLDFAANSECSVSKLICSKVHIGILRVLWRPVHFKRIPGAGINKGELAS